MRIIRRILAAAVGSAAAFTIALLAGSSSHQTSAQPQISAPNILTSVLASSPRPHAQEALVGDVVSAPTSKLKLGAAEPTKFQWYSCVEDVPASSNVLAPSCSPIRGATAAQVELSNVEVGKHLLFSMSVGNGPVAFSATTEAAVVPAPTLSAAPTGLNKSLKFVAATSPTLNSKITVARGTWPTAAAVSSISYQWLRCTDVSTSSTTAPANCTTIDGPTGASYVVTAADLGYRIVVHATAVQGGVTSEVWTSSIGPVFKAVKYYRGAAVTGGNGDYPFLVGQAVTALEGTWDGPPNFTYQWYSCTAKVAAAATLNKLCKVIAGAVNDSFTPTVAQNGKFLMVRLAGSTPLATTVITTYSAGSTKVLDDPTNTVVATLPAAAPVVGDTFTLRSGTWQGSPTPTVSYQWYLCDTDELTAGADKPDDCNAIAGATSKTITPIQSMYGSYLLVEEKATSLAGTDSIFSATSLPVASRPIYESDPVVLGVTELGQTLSAISGVGGSSMQTSIDYQWLACPTLGAVTNAKPANCNVIQGATTETYAPTRSVEGLFIAVQVTLGNTAGNTVKVSATTSQFVKSTPNLDSTDYNPAVDVIVGTAVNAPAGLWRGAPAPTFNYQWLVCDAVGAKSDSLPSGCAEIPSATGASFTPTHAQAGGFLRVRVTANNEKGAFTVFSGATGALKERPTFAGSPVLSLGALVGSQIDLTDTSAYGVPTPTRTIAWYQCQNQVLANTNSVPTAANCTVLTGATAASYTPNNGDLNKYIGALVTATSSTGSASVFTATSSKILGLPSLLNSNPSAPGTAGVSPRVKVAINAPSTTWVGSPTPTANYQWYSCADEFLTAGSAMPDVCLEIPGATTSSFTPTVSEVDRYLMVRVGASNSIGSAARFTPTTAIVQEAPNFTSDPSISGGKFTGDDVSFDTLFTRGSPAPDLSYAWYRCDAAVTTVQATTTCPKIAGETGTTYTLSAADLDKYIVGAVTLTSPLGVATKITLSTVKIQGAPALVGTLGAPSATAVKVDSPITMPTVKWTGSPAVTSSYQWFACSREISAALTTIDTTYCQLISGANLASYTPTIAQVSKFLVVRIIATNAIGTVTIYTPTTSAVNEVPSFQGDLSIDDVSLVGSKVSVFLPATRGFPAPTPTYSWYRCTAAVPFSATTVPTTCSVIANATANQYELDTPDLDKFVLAGVTLTNGSGTTTKFSPSTISIQGLPKLSNALGSPSSSIAGVLAARIGVPENAPTNTWTGSPKPTVQLQWVRCQDESQLSSTTAVPCDDIAGATATTYTPTLADKGLALRVRITATNALGTTTIWSGSTRKTQQPPTFAADPTLNDFITVYTLLSVNPVQQVAYPVATESYTWYRCPKLVSAASANPPVDSCVQLLNESVSTHTILPEDADSYLVAKVTLTNEAGAVSRYTASTAQIISLPVFNQEASVVGQSYVTGKLTLGTFSVTAKPAAKLTYQWYNCPYQIRVSTSVASSDCRAIAGETSDTYFPTAELANRFVSVLATATNTAGSTSSFSKTTPMILMPPKNVVPQVVTGATVVGNALDTDTGTWTPDTGVTFDIAWYACVKPTVAADTISTTDCSIVTGATSSRFTTTTAQVGKYMVSAVTAKNFTINVIKYSASTEIIADFPVYQSQMGVNFAAGQASTSGAPRVGYKISATEGIWAGTPAPTFTYQWFVCSVQKTSADKSRTADCRDINEATTKDFTITPSLATDYNLVGKYLGVKVTGTNKAGTDFAFSATSLKTVTVPPQLVTPPDVTGYRYVDAQLSGTMGTFTGTPATTETQSWWQCDSAITDATTTQPAGCVRLVPTTANIKLTLAMKGKFVTTATTSVNDAGTLTVWAAQTVAVTTGAINTVPPTIGVNPVGVPKVGGTLTANHGTWSGDPALTEADYAYQWYSCAIEIKQASFTLDPTAECIRVGDAVNTTYQPVRDDAGRYILVSVTGTNLNGGSRIFSGSTTKVNLPPESVVAPVQTGTAFVGSRQNTSDGTWLGVPDPTFTYQWLVCNSEQSVPPSAKPADCSVVSGVTSSVYVPTISQIGQFLMVQVTATNIAGSAVAYSLTSTEIVSAPVNKVAPTVLISNGTSGLPVANQSTLSSAGGQWDGRPSPTLELQWFSCATALAASASEPDPAADCKSVTDLGPGVTYDPVTSDRGRFVLVKVVATNTHASVPYWSATTSVINMAPIIDVTPTVGGVAFVQAVVTAKSDTWLAYPAPTRSFQWLSCGDIELPSACSVISGASAATFTIPSNLEGRSLIVKVTATNQFGSSSSYSLASAKITTGPVSTAPQVISGSVAYPPAAGAVLSSTDGTWAGNPRPTLAYQWFRCSAVVANSAFEYDPTVCSAIDGATSNTFALSDVDPGNALMIAVTGTNSFGTSTRYSASTPIVTEKVRMITSPTLTSSAKIGQDITADEGTWRGFPKPDTTYSWYSCTTANPAAPVQLPAASGTGVTPPPACTKINGAVRSSLAVSDSQVGKMLIFMVTKTNTVDGVTTTINAYTQSSLPAAQPPVSLAKPVITSPGMVAGANPKVGSIWTVSTGLWADPQPVKAYQWYRCDNQVATGPTPITSLPNQTCVAIAGATSTSYTIVAEDSAKYITIEAIASNAADTIHQWSNSTLSVLQVPIAITPPTISGSRLRGNTLTIDQGIWTGSPTPVITFQWYSCLSPVGATSTTVPTASTCSQISGETKATYVQSAAGSDDGKYITATVSGTSGNSDPTVYWVTVAASDATAKAPSSIALPTLQAQSGLKPAVGEIYTIVDDRWLGAPTPAFTYKWYACSAVVAAAGTALPTGCTEIAGATSKSYTATVALADSAKYLLGSVTATNLAGSATVYTKSLDMIIDKGITNTAPPTITAANLVVPIDSNAPITGVSGTWTSNKELRVYHDWYACPFAITTVSTGIPLDCWRIRVDGATLAPVTVDKLADISGNYIALYETVDQKTDTGTWQRVRTRLSATTGMLLEAPSLRSSNPAFVAPSVSQDMVVGYASNANAGAWVASLNGETAYTWRGAPSGSFTYQWFSCPSSQPSNVLTDLPAGCSYISNSANHPTTASTFTPIESEIGSFIGARITATNASGSFSVWTATSKAVTQEVANLTPPTLGAAYIVDDRLTLAGGLQTDWKGSPAPAITVDWFSCDAPHPAPLSSIPAGCVSFVNGTASPSTGITLPVERSTGTQYLLARITGVNSAWSQPKPATTVTLYTGTSHRIISRPYINPTIANSNPSQTGWADVGSALTITPGNWLGTMPMTFSGRWFACDTTKAATNTASPGSDCTLFKSGTQSVLLTHAQVNKYIVGQMVATNEAGTTYQSAPASVKVLEPPTIVSPPEVTLYDPALPSGKNEVGQRLTLNNPVWDGSGTITTLNKFYACDSPNQSPVAAIPAGCVPMLGVNGIIATLTDAEAGKYIVIVSTASNTVNQGVKLTTSVSASMGPVYRTPYFDTAVAPTLSGTAHVGQAVNFTRASVKGYEAPTVTYSWYICDSQVSSAVNDAVPAGCSAIADNPNAPLVVPAAAAGKYVLAIQTASASWTPVKVTRSTLTSQQITASPSATVAPTLSGDDFVGGANRVSVGLGTWSSFPAITDPAKYAVTIYQCDTQATVTTTVPNNCSSVLTFTGASPQTYAPIAAQAGKFLLAKVIATAPTNKVPAGDSVTAYSTMFGPIRQAPTLPAQPTITGTATPDVGTTLSMVTTTPGGFPVNTPTYDWYICATGGSTVPQTIPANCDLQSAYSSKSFPIPSAAAGKYVLGWVTATNELGSVSKATAFTSIVKMAAVNSAAPTISGGDEVGTPITATQGSWTSYPAPNFVYGFYSCDTATSTVSVGCTSIAGNQSSASFTPTEAQAGKYILVNVTATTAIYSGNPQAVKASTTLGPIRMPATIKVAPVITGMPHVGETLSLSIPAGQLAGYPDPAPNFSYDWYACDTAVASVSSIPTNCALIPGFTKKALVIDAQYAGKFIIAAATANNYASVLRTSAAPVAVSATLVNSSAPVLTGDVYVGGANAITASTGTWSSAPAVNPATDLAYAFFTCVTSTWSASCDPITTANNKVTSVNLTSAMQGKYVFARVTATVATNKPNTNTATATTNAIGPVEAAPAFTATPTTAGVLHVGSLITATSSGETGVPAPSKTYSWFFCNSAVTANATSMPAGCTAADSSIDGQPTITLPTEAGGKFVSVMVSLSNNRGQVQAASATLRVVTATPVKTADPVISGDDVSATGKTLSVTDGTWVTAPSTATKTFAYSWYACPAANSAIANCAYIGDTATRSIPISDAMVDKFVVAKVTVSVPVEKSGAGTAYAYSNASNRIRKSAAFTANPVVSGFMNIGQTVTASSGNPTGVPAPSLVYAWYVCTSPVAASVAAPPAGCVLDSSSITSNYVIPNSAAGSYILVIAKASSDSDLATVYRSSVSSLAVSAGATLGATAPAIAGTPVLGSNPLTVSNGTWTWKPTTATAIYSYRWFACPSTLTATSGSVNLPDVNCKVIASQTASSLTLTTAELGYKIVTEISVTVPTNTATPSVSVYYTAPTTLVMSKPAAGSTPPTISYTTLTVGSALSARTGTWTGSPAPVLSYTWYKCPANTTQPTNKLAPATCTALAAKGDLPITADLKGFKILLYVLASTDGAGTATNVSALLAIP